VRVLLRRYCGYASTRSDLHRSLPLYGTLLGRQHGFKNFPHFFFDIKGDKSIQYDIDKFLLASTKAATVFRRK
jgi:hypothetical protein